MTYGAPSQNHITKMNKDLGKLDGFPIVNFMSTPPAKNSSESVKQEIKYIQSIPRDEKFIKDADDVSGYFRQYIEALGYDYPKDHVKKLLDNSSSIILKLKYHYNRPRPSDLAKIFGYELDNYYMKSMGTPSYPSGHSTQGILIALSLSDMFPEYKNNIMKLGMDISNSRQMSKAHYPSDSKFGEKLGGELYKYMKKDTLSEALLDRETIVGYRWKDFQKNYLKLNPKYKIVHDKKENIYYGFKKGTKVAHWKYFDDKSELFINDKMDARKIMTGRADKNIFEQK